MASSNRLMIVDNASDEVFDNAPDAVLDEVFDEALEKTLENAPENVREVMQSALSSIAVFNPQAKQFWKAQHQLLEETEKYSSVWFSRRHDATKSALDAVSQVSKDGMYDPAYTLRVIADWQTHSMKRLSKDAKDYREMMTRCFSMSRSEERKGS